MEYPLMISLSYCQFDSPVGPFCVIVKGDTLVQLDFPDHPDRMVRLLKRRFNSFELIPVEDPIGAKTAVLAYLDGDFTALDRLPCDLGGTAFQQTVWQALRHIPLGQTQTYLGLAKAIGRPKSVRAVANANAQNPISLIYPCHRVIGSNGTLTGYAGGLHRKEWLLRHEGALS